MIPPDSAFLLEIALFAEKIVFKRLKIMVSSR